MESREELLQQKGFDEGQQKQAELGFREGLSVEQVAFYYRPEFDDLQMREARLGFQNGLSMEQITFYYKPELSWLLMGVIREDLERERFKEQTGI